VYLLWEESEILWDVGGKCDKLVFGRKVGVLWWRKVRSLGGGRKV